MMKSYVVRDSAPESVHEALKVYPELLRELLYSRGIETPEEARKFLVPDYDAGIHDPFLMKGMDVAVERILKAIKENERIGVYTDYDCDGNPAAVLFHDFFNKIGYENFINYIPHRHKEGYGLNIGAIDGLHKEGVQLLITADLGITDVESVAHANELGMDVIVTDHHLPNGDLPPALAILNPKQEDCKYPFDGLCGTGVAYKLIQGLLEKGEFDLKSGWEKWWLDMVGLATVADMVPLVDENRVFAHYGLTVLRKTPRLGIQKLCRKMNIMQRNLTEDDIGFMIAPRINAASRMGEAMDAFKLLTAQDDTEADLLAKHLDKINNERKGLVASMTKEIKKRLEHAEVGDVLLLGNPKWRPALLGLSANSLVEEYQRPVFLWGREESGVLKGSCRSDGSVDLVELMNEVAGSLIEFGGHAFSGGFSVLEENIHSLQQKLSDAHKKIKKEIDEAVEIDHKLKMEDVGWRVYGALGQLAPFGEGNKKPLFLFEGVEVSEVAMFGKAKEHLKLIFKKKDGGVVEAINFFTPDTMLQKAKEGAVLNLVAHMDRSYFRNSPALRLRIVDLI